MLFSNCIFWVELPLDKSTGAPLKTKSIATKKHSDIPHKKYKNTDALKNIKNQKNILLVSDIVQPIHKELEQIKIDNANLHKELNIILTQMPLSQASIQIFLGIFSILLIILTLILGVCLHFMTEKIKYIKMENEKIVEKHLEIKDAVIATNEDIKNNMTKIYKDLRKEEFDNILARLEAVPEDIVHYVSFFLSNDLPYNCFQKIKNLINIITKKPSLIAPDKEEFKEIYLNVLYQHYSYELLIDSELYSDFEKKYEIFIAGSFNNDILSHTKALCKVFLKNNRLEIITNFLKALLTSKFKEYKDLYLFIFNMLNEANPNNIKILFNTLESNQELKLAKTMFISILEENIQNTNSKIIKEIYSNIKEEK